MIRSLLAPALIAPLMLAGIIGSVPAIIGAGMVAIGLFAYLLARQTDGVETGAAILGRVTMRSLIFGMYAHGTLYYDYPIYLSGVNFGVMPATDWYTAKVDGQTVLVLEPVEMPSAKA